MRRAVLLFLLLAGGCASAPQGAAPTVAGELAANATVVRVVDGDTVVVEIGGTTETVRLIGIDTPETKKPNTPVQCFGPEASDFTKHLLPAGTALHLERDVEARDKYGRLLAYAYLVPDGTFVNLTIVREGYARLLTIPPNVAHSADFVAAARAAQQEDAGLWGGCTGTAG